MYRINDIVLHTCYFISKIPNCKNFCGIYFKQENCKILNYKNKVYNCEFNCGKFNVVKNNLSELGAYELLEFRSYFNKKNLKKIEQILNYDRGNNIIDPALIGNLHITYGLSIDTSILIIKENNILIDEKCIYEYIKLNSG